MLVSKARQSLCWAAKYINGWGFHLKHLFVALKPRERTSIFIKYRTDVSNTVDSSLSIETVLFCRLQEVNFRGKFFK